MLVSATTSESWGKADSPVTEGSQLLVVANNPHMTRQPVSGAHLRIYASALLCDWWEMPCMLNESKRSLHERIGNAAMQTTTA